MKKMFTVIGVLGVLTLPLSGFAESISADGEKIGVVESVYYIKGDNAPPAAIAGQTASLGNTLGGSTGAIVGLIGGLFGSGPLAMAMQPKTQLEITVTLEGGEKVTVTQPQEEGEGFTAGDKVRVLSDASGLHVAH